VFAVLDAYGVVFGDVSMRNLLWSASGGGGGYLIDCDTAQTDPPRSPSPLTMDWEDPHVAGDPAHQPADLASDRYKLTLVVYRAVVRHPTRRPPATMKEIHATMSEPVPNALVGLLLAGSGPDRPARPRPADWLSVMDSWLPPDWAEPTPPEPVPPIQGSSTRERPRPWVSVDPASVRPTQEPPTNEPARGRPGRTHDPSGRPLGGSSTAGRKRKVHRVRGPVPEHSTGTPDNSEASRRSADEAGGNQSDTTPATPNSGAGMSGFAKSILWAIAIAVIVIVVASL
jgi:hypothetical protein